MTVKSLSYSMALRFLLATVTTLFIVEGGIMWVFHNVWAPADPQAEGILDAAIISLAMTPVLYFFLYRPLVRQVEQTAAVASSVHSIETRLPTVLNASKDAMIAIGPDGCVTMFNTAAEAMFGWTAAEMFGKPLDPIVPAEYRGDHERYASEFFNNRKGRREIGRTVEFPALRKDGSRFSIELTLSSGTFEGEDFVLAVIRDITERKDIEYEREQLIEELQQALTDFETLSGMLPICSECKKIGDDQGAWRQIETFIAEHSEAKFTHAICPDCKAKLYPNLD